MHLICYLSNGYPSIAGSIQMAKTYVEAGCTMIEIDFPSHDPFLEGELIAGRMKQALAACGDYGAYMEGMAAVKKQLPQTHFILMVYENTVREIGVERLIRFCVENEYRDIILVGLQDDVIKNRLIAAGLRISCYVRFQMFESEVEQALHSNGFMYLQAVPGPGEINPAYPTLKDCIRYLRGRGFQAPIYCGVGVHSPEQVATVKAAGGDGVFVGSVVLKLQDNPPAQIEMIRRLKAEC